MFDGSVFTVNEANLASRIGQAKFYLEEYEKEVADRNRFATFCINVCCLLRSLLRTRHGHGI